MPKNPFYNKSIIGQHTAHTAIRLPSAICWFVFEEYDEFEVAKGVMRELGITEARVLFSWADWARPRGREWFNYFTSRLVVAGIHLVPCLFYTPLETTRKKAGKDAKTSYPPQDVRQYSTFVRDVILRYGAAFEWIQLWNEANWHVYWDWDLDPVEGFCGDDELCHPCCQRI